MESMTLDDYLKTIKLTGLDKGEYKAIEAALVDKDKQMTKQNDTNTLSVLKSDKRLPDESGNKMPFLTIDEYLRTIKLRHIDKGEYKAIEAAIVHMDQKLFGQRSMNRKPSKELRDHQLNDNSELQASDQQDRNRKRTNDIGKHGSTSYNESYQLDSQPNCIAKRKPVSHLQQHDTTDSSKLQMLDQHSFIAECSSSKRPRTFGPCGMKEIGEQLSSEQISNCFAHANIKNMSTNELKEHDNETGDKCDNELNCVTNDMLHKKAGITSSNLTKETNHIIINSTSVDEKGAIEPTNKDTNNVDISSAKEKVTNTTKPVKFQPKVFVCDLCKKEFSFKCNMQTHRRTHTGEKPYTCNVCQAEFRRPNHLKNHMLTHTGETPYKCGICEASFAHASSMVLHQRMHTGEKPYKCEICGLTFNAANNLRRHRRTHTGETPYQCLSCSACFTQPYNLKRHLRIHTGEKPYPCSECNRTFVQASHLKYHMKTHLNENQKGDG